MEQLAPRGGSRSIELLFIGEECLVDDSVRFLETWLDRQEQRTQLQQSEPSRLEDDSQVSLACQIHFELGEFYFDREDFARARRHFLGTHRLLQASPVSYDQGRYGKHLVQYHLTLDLLQIDLRT